MGTGEMGKNARNGHGTFKQLCAETGGTEERGARTGVRNLVGISLARSLGSWKGSCRKAQSRMKREGHGATRWAGSGHLVVGEGRKKNREGRKRRRCLNISGIPCETDARVCARQRHEWADREEDYGALKMQRSGGRGDSSRCESTAVGNGAGMSGELGESGASVPLDHARASWRDELSAGFATDQASHPLAKAASRPLPRATRVSEKCVAVTPPAGEPREVLRR